MQINPPSQLIDQLSNVSDPTIPGEDKKARAEEDYLAKDLSRQNHAKTHLHWVFLGVLWVCFSCFLCIFIIRLSHLVLPDRLQWMSGEQIQGIDKLLFSGAIGGFVGRYFDKFSKSSAE
jgi:hypothetical protein